MATASGFYVSGQKIDIFATSAKNSEKLGGQAPSYYATKTLVDGKQDKLTAVSPIVIKDNKISNNGNDCVVSGTNAWAEGNNTLANGYASHAEGTNNVANGEAAHIEGENNIADDLCDHVEGMGGIASHGGMMHIEGFQYHSYTGNGPASDYYGNNVVRFYNTMNFSVKDASIYGSLYEFVKAFKEKFLVSCEYGSQSEYHYTGNTFYDPKLYKILDVNLNNGFIEITIDGTIDCQSDGSIILYGPTSIASITGSGGSLSSNQKLKQYTFYSLGFPGNNLKTVTPENTFISIKYYYTRSGSSEENYFKILKISSIEQANNGYLITTDEEIEIPEIIGGGYNITLYRISPSYYGNNHIEGSDNTIRYCSNSHIEGSTNLICSNCSHAEGNYTTANGNASHVEGYGTYTNDAYTHAEGYYTTANGEAAHAEGKNTVSRGVAAHAEGYNTIAAGNYTHAEGSETTASHVGTHAEGDRTRATMYQAHAEGFNTSATMDHAHAEGEATLASERDAHAEGWGTSATAPNTHSEGYYSIATNNEAHAEGNYTTAAGFASHAEGQHCLATTTAAHAEGYNTNSYGQGSHSEGYLTTATNEAAHVEGKNVAAHGIASHAEGYMTSAMVDHAHAEGEGCIASGRDAHAEGWGTSAIGEAAHAEGKATKTFSTSSENIANQFWDSQSAEYINRWHAAGWNDIDVSNIVYDSSLRAYVGTAYLSAVADYSHAGGLGTKICSEAGTVIGKYNSNTSAAFIVGNGTDDANRSDALTVDWDGNVSAANFYGLASMASKLNSNFYSAKQARSVKKIGTIIGSGDIYAGLVFAVIIRDNSGNNDTGILTIRKYEWGNNKSFGVTDNSSNFVVLDARNPTNTDRPKFYINSTLNGNQVTIDVWINKQTFVGLSLLSAPEDTIKWIPDVNQVAGTLPSTAEEIPTYRAVLGNRSAAVGGEEDPVYLNALGQLQVASRTKSGGVGTAQIANHSCIFVTTTSDINYSSLPADKYRIIVNMGANTIRLRNDSSRAISVYNNSNSVSSVSASGYTNITTAKGINMIMKYGEKVYICKAS